MKHTNPRSIELLAPARDSHIAIEALRHGADAIYIGGPSHSARHAAGNSVADIARAVDFAHQFDARVYVTLNTLIYEDELSAVEKLIAQYYKIGVDALIVQDMAILRMDIPPIALHASTQCNIDTIEKARFMADMGFSQIVVPREMSVTEMARMAEAVDVPLEAFVHGALCVSYSGNCQAGHACMGRSANRGECPQVCRYKFDLEDKGGNTIIAGKHLLSLRDLNRSHSIGQLLEAGISSLKVEGRLKDIAYVKNVTAAYRRELDKIIEQSNGLYRRSSLGNIKLNFTPDLSKSFNRDFTEYFTHGESASKPMSSADTPKWKGEPIGKISFCKGIEVGVHLNKGIEINNGDGIGYFNSDAEYEGFRVNKAEPTRLLAAKRINIPKCTLLYRNNDYAFEQTMQGDTAFRTIAVEMHLRPISWGVALDITSAGIKGISICMPNENQLANTPQELTRKETLSKSGNTIFRVAKLTDDLGPLFVPRSTLAQLRRDGLELLSKNITGTHVYQKRGKEDIALLYPAKELDYHYNIANHLAKAFYQSHGAEVKQQAIELWDMPIKQGTVVMTTKYCLRKEMGLCLKNMNTDKTPLPAELYLRSGKNRWRLHFDCTRCGMTISIAD